MYKILIAFFLLIGFKGLGQMTDTVIVIQSGGISTKLIRQYREESSGRFTNGIHILFWDMGFKRIFRQFYMKDGKIEDVVPTFNENGLMNKLENYKESYEEGYFYFWNNNGILVRKEFYNHGVLRRKWINKN